MASKFVKTLRVEGSPLLGASDYNRIEEGIEEALEQIAVRLKDVEECKATSIKEVVVYINELVKALKG